MRRGSRLGGTTYCCIAALHLAGTTDMFEGPTRTRTLDWLYHRQVTLDPDLLDEDDFSTEQDQRVLSDLETGRTKVHGVQGRPEKDPDACYSFWVTASIQVCRSSSRAGYPHVHRGHAQGLNIPIMRATHPPQLLASAPDQDRSESARQDTSFLLLCQMPRMGGIAKFPGEYPGEGREALKTARLYSKHTGSLRKADRVSSMRLS